MIMTRKEVAEYLRKSVDTISRWTSQGLLRVHKINRTNYYYKEEIDEDIRRM